MISNEVIGKRLKKCAEKLGIKQSKDPAASNIPYGIDQGSVSKWFQGKIPKPQFAAFCCKVGMSFDESPENTAESVVSPSLNLDPKTRIQMEAIVADLAAYEKELPGAIEMTKNFLAFYRQKDRISREVEEEYAESDATVGQDELAEGQAALGEMLRDIPTSDPRFQTVLASVSLLGRLISARKRLDRVRTAEKQKSPAPKDAPGL